ncbi:MAG: hypothetical protein WD851_23365 [Pirellulales bacterium]
MGSDYEQELGAGKAQATLLVLFIPSVDRDSKPIDQQLWVDRALRMLGTCFGGATAFPRAQGVWRDDARDGELIFDEPVIIQCYSSEAAIEEEIGPLRDFLYELGRTTNQGAVGIVIDRDYLEIPFSTDE